ncbi:MAG: ARMT1-like domain-containing protein, partial [Thermoplasmatota archaeon]
PVDGWVKPEHLEQYKDADILLAKGQGNFESLSEAGGVYFLLIVKCDVVAEYLNVDLGEMVFMYSGDG